MEKISRIITFITILALIPIDYFLWNVVFSERIPFSFCVKDAIKSCKKYYKE